MTRPALFLVVALGFATTAHSQSYEDLMAVGDTTTEQNNMNAPFVDPSTLTAVTNPSAWPKFQNRAPADRSPQDMPSKLITTGTPTGSTYRFGLAMALIVNGYPYFMDAGEGWWRAINRATLSQGGLNLTKILTVENVKYMFLTHLHEDHKYKLI